MICPFAIHNSPFTNRIHFMKPKYLIAAAIISIFNFQFSISLAQTDSTNSSYNESVIVVGDYNPVLDGVTEKVNVAPAVSETSSENAMPTFTYSITPRRISSLSTTTGIKAAKVVGSPTRLYNNYLRLGIGHDFASFVDFTPLVDLYLTSMRNDNYAYGARLYHQTDVTTFGKYDETTPSPDYLSRNRQSITRFDIFGKYILNKKHLFSSNLAFDREYGRYYGFSDSVLFSKTSLLRNDIDYSDYAFAYNNAELAFGAKSLNTDVNKLGYEANVNMDDFWSRYHANQLSMDANANIHYGFPMFRQYKAIAYLNARWRGYKQSNTQAFKHSSTQALITLPLGYDTTASIPDTVNDGRSLFTVGPRVDFLFNGMKFHVGATLGVNGYDSVNSRFNLFPDIAVAKSFANNALSLTVGFKGDYKANDWNSIRLANPYVEPAPLSMATISNNLYAHFRMSFSKKLMLNINVDNMFNKNDLYFELDKKYILNNVFKTYYLDVNNINLAADITFVNDEMITMTLGMNYQHDYNVPDNKPILYYPNFTAHFDAQVNYKDKWFFTLNTLFLGSIDADYEYNALIGRNEVTVTLPAHFGVALEAEYVHSRALSFFAKLDNLTFQRYYLWANYPAARFNAMLGLTYTIPNQ